MSAIGIAAMTFVLLFGMIGGMIEDLRYNLQTFFTGEVRIRHIEYNKYEHLHPLHLGVEPLEQVLEIVAADPSVDLAVPRIGFGTMIYIGGNNYKAMGVGIDMERELEYQDLATHITEGRLPENGNNEAILGIGLAEEMSIGIGDTFTLLSKTRGRGTNAITFQVTGLMKLPVVGLNNTHFYAPLDRVRYFLRMDESVSEILMKLHPGESAREAAGRLNTAFSDAGLDTLEAGTWTSIPSTFQLMKIGEAVYYLIAAIFFLLGSTVIVNTTMMVIYERMREIGTISAMGMTGGEIVRLFFLEAFFISVIGAAAGVIIGIVLTLPLSYFGIDFTAAMSGVDFEINPVVKFVITWKSTVMVFFYSVIVASAASLLPSSRAAKIEPIEALRAV